MIPRLLLSALLALSLAGCEEAAQPAPEPVTMTQDAIGHFCQMNLSEHGGPKGQVHLKGQPHPLFFSQVRDVLAFNLLPEQEGEITAIYVSDMGAAPSWEAPGADNWIAATEAFYVTGSTQAGGMGAPEMIPFGTEAQAHSFAEAKGGTVSRMDQIPAEAVLAADGPAADAGDDDYAARLEALAAAKRQEAPQ